METMNQGGVLVQKIALPESYKFQVKHLPIKRTFDILFSLSVLLLFSPLYLALALMIRLTSKGKAIYFHERIGRGGKPFKCYKFRSMYSDADNRLKELLKSDPALKIEWNKKHKLKNDPRVTPIGKLLRKTSLDELPQFWNVLKSDLSVVGPRPVVREEIERHFGVKANKILSIRPGLTGIWQVSGRSNTSYDERIALDEKYINSHNLALDIKLIFLTIPRMIFAKGAY